MGSYVYDTMLSGLLILYRLLIEISISLLMEISPPSFSPPSFHYLAKGKQMRNKDRASGVDWDKYQKDRLDGLVVCDGD